MTTRGAKGTFFFSKFVDFKNSEENVYFNILESDGCVWACEQLIANRNDSDYFSKTSPFLSLVFLGGPVSVRWC